MVILLGAAALITEALDRLTPEQREFFDERSAIMEHCAGMDRDRADMAAYELTCHRYGLNCVLDRQMELGLPTGLDRPSAGLYPHG